VEAVTSKVGVHMRLTDEVDAWKIKHSFELAREMGATWAVEYFPWPYIEGEAQGVTSDAIVDEALRETPESEATAA